MIVGGGLSHEPEHPLGSLISAAVAGSFPPVDGGWHRVEPWRPGLEAIVAFTGHAVLAIAPDISDEQLVTAGVDGYGGAHDPRLVAGLAGDSGWVDSLDVLLVGRGAGAPDTPPRLVSRPDLATHPRVQFAAAVRDDVRVLGHPDARRSAVAVVGRGVGGHTELSIELEPEHRGGRGPDLITDALTTIPAGCLVVASVAPGNAASLRSFLAAQFVPIGSLQLFARGSH